ncbi:DUF2141 domain-containing protein [Sphingorhabdus sp.]|uniref:DUF2141 domain-containing protein n=1 Tax=Sphingorhabdus sp. TaxID=1902408 RepID=UPI00359434DA
MAIGVAALVPGTALDATSTASTLDLSIYGLRSMKGNVLVCVTANPKFFPDCSKDPKSHRAKVAAPDAGNISFKGLEQGTYAVALIHDENANSKMDMAIFLPKEGFGFSRNPVIVAGPPRFKAAAFAIGADEVNQRVKMKYML